MLLAQAPQPWETIVPATPDQPWTGCVIEYENGVPGAPTLKCLEAVFANIVSSVMTLAGIALFVMLVIGAFRYLTSGGEPKAVESARKTMTYAIVGIVIIVSSYLVLRLLTNFTGVDLLKFEIPYF